MQTIDYKKTKKCNIACGGMQGSYYGANCMFFGFLISYLSSRGYSNILIGIISTILAASTMISQPITGYIIDSFITPKKLLKILSLASIPFVIIFFIFNDNKVITMILIAIISALSTPLCGIIDSWSVRLRENNIPVNYPITRSMGSIFYSLMALSMGYVIARVGYLVIIPTYILALLSMILFSCLADDVPCKNKSAVNNSSSKRISLPTAFKILIKTPEYTIFLISYFFYNLSMKVIITFITNIITERGGTPTHLGIALFIAAFFELPFLLIFSKYIMRLKFHIIYLISLALGLIRVVSINMFSGINIIMFSQFFQGFSYGLSIPFLIEYINKIIPENLKATAITICLAVGSGAALIIGNSLGGVIMENYGTEVFINCMTISMLLSAAIFIIPTIILNKNKKTI